MWKDLFYFSKSDRRALSVFVLVIFAGTIVRVTRPAASPVPQEDTLINDDTAQIVAVPIQERKDDGEIPVQRASMYPKRVKYPYGTVLNLNESDTTELKKVPGIGSYYARRIVEYRERLGGYVSTDQLLEIEHLPDSVRGWFMVSDTFHVRKLQVNVASLSQLRQHPYMDFYKARAIVEYRQRNGDIKNPASLSLFQEFSGQDLERLEPYLDFTSQPRH